jgi:PAS domain S-box-containing protein
MSMKTKLLNISVLLLLSLFLLSFTTHKKDSEPQSKEKAIYINNIEILTGLAGKVYLHNPERSLQYAQTALVLARKNNDMIYEAKVLVLIGSIYKRSDLDRLSIPFYSQAITISSKLKNTLWIADNSLALGEAYYKLNYADSASKYFNRSLILYTGLNDKKGIATTMIRLGNTYWYSAGYDKALELYLKSLAISEEINNKNGIAEANTNIGALYVMLGDNQNALLYLRRATCYIDFFENKEKISNLYYRYGFAFENLQQYDSAFFYYKLAKNILDTLHLDRRSGNIDESISSIYFKQGNTEKAIKQAQIALEKYIKNDYRFGIASVYNNMAIYYLKIEDYTNSLSFLEKGIKLSKEIKSIELLKINYLTLSKYYKNKEMYKKALLYHELYQQMNDSVLNHEKNTRIAELQTKYETNKNMQELASKTEENRMNMERIKRQRRNLYVFGFGSLVILIMSIGLYRQYKLLESREARIKEINKELDLRVKDRTSALQLSQFSIENAADPIFWLDNNGNFIFANIAACKYLEYTKEEFLQGNIINIIPKFSLTEWKDVWDIIHNDGSLVLELFFKKKNKIIFPVEIAFNYIAHEGKEYAFAFIRDISDRKLKEENLRKAKEKAEEADKLKSAFLANMSHEIRTPMNAILGFSDLLIGDDISPDEKQEFANIIKSSTDTLLKLIDDIIDISLIDAGQLKMHKTNFQLNNTLKEVIRFYQEEKIRVQKPHLDIRLNESSFNDQIILNTDPIRFRQIVTNLIGNAIKFTDKGYIETGYIIGPDKVKIYVKDTGIGIPTDKIPMIFERFRKHNDNGKLYGGTGLGLAISKKMVEQMGGSISAASEINKGSIFWFTIPFKLGTINPPLPQNNNINNDYDWGKKSLLIVEDVESNYLYLETVLKKTGINIFWAKDGDEALSYCRIKRPDAVLMDIQLPKKDGYMVTSEILQIYPHTPIIAQTAYAFTDEKEKILKAGCVDYLTKPIDSKLLLETINNYIS